MVRSEVQFESIAYSSYAATRTTRQVAKNAA
jgi:hypothetical protein